MAQAPDKTIAETAIATDDFNTLVAAVEAAGLVEALQGEGTFVLTYHVVPGKMMSADLMGQQLEAETAHAVPSRSTRRMASRL